MKINLILLAAGNSKRFLGNKLLHEFKGKPMYMHILDKIKDINFNKIIVVTQYKEIEQYLYKSNIDVIINNESYRGISSSIHLGIESDKKADGYMFMVCDQPFIKKQTILNLITYFNNSNKGIVAASYNKKPRNPVIFSRKYLNDLLNLNGDIGGSCIIKNNLEDLSLVEVSDKLEVYDIDTKNDLYIEEKKY